MTMECEYFACVSVFTLNIILGLCGTDFLSEDQYHSQSVGLLIVPVMAVGSGKYSGQLSHQKINPNEGHRYSE